MTAPGDLILEQRGQRPLPFLFRNVLGLGADEVHALVAHGVCR
jgi:hypothetical protein